MAEADRTRAAEATSEHMRGTLERSAEAWGTRADLLGRLEASSSARAEAVAREQEALRSERMTHGQGTGSTEQGEAQAEGGRRQVEERARPRIKGLSPVPERKDEDAD
jgi:hypothetical protein